MSLSIDHMSQNDRLRGQVYPVGSSVRSGLAEDLLYVLPAPRRGGR